MSRRTLAVSFFVTLACSLLVLAKWSAAQEEQLPEGGAQQPPPPTDARHYSYAIGLDIGSSFSGDGLKLDVESLMAGLRDGLENRQPKYSRELCGVALQRMQIERMKNLKARGEAFLAKNAKAKGVQTTDTGLQYQVLKAANGASPKASDRVRVHYEGRFLDGSVFDGSAGGPPAEFRVTGVIPGWTEALQKMKVGEKWRLFIPSELAYGPQGRDGIPPYSVLVFELELLDIL